MKFMIHGADQKTGRELTVVIDAADRTEAEQRVLYNDILIASLAHYVPPTPPPAPMIGYNRPDPAPGERNLRTRTPFYKEILRGAKWLGGLAFAVRMFGVLFALLALCAIALPLIKPIREIMPFAVIPLVWFIGGALLLTLGFMCMLCGATVSMLSGLALAIRDMARNSFHEEPPIEVVQRRETSTLTIQQVPSAHLLPGM
jgi:hypothetical protein